MHRTDANHPWLFTRCRELESNPDGYLDLWARYHYKSSFGTFGGIIQEVLRDPDITIGILSATKALADPFLVQIQQEFENNLDLQNAFPDVLWRNPKREADRWSRSTGIVVKRKSNPKEGTVEAHGLIDGQPTGRHFKLLVYDDVVTQDLVGNPEIVKKVTERWELSDNLGTHGRTRKWHFGTRYSFGDSYGQIMEDGRLKPRIYPATDDGSPDGNPVLLTRERWAEVKNAQKSTVYAQMLLNPIAGNEAMFRAEWLKSFDVRPTILNIYIMVDPSKGKTKRSDRTAIAVVGVDVAGNRYFLDGVRHRMPLSERWQHLKRLYLKWSGARGTQVVVVGYERYGAQTEDEVIKQWQERDGIAFQLVELNWPREGEHSKKDRVERLEPDIRQGRFYFPSVIYHPSMGGIGGMAYWSIWTKGKAEAARAAGKKVDFNVGQIVYTPYKGPTKQQVTCERLQQGYRVQGPIKAIDEERHVYDVTRAFFEEALQFPFSPKDDLVDATSRLYDLQPRPAVQFEAEQAEQPIYADT